MCTGRPGHPCLACRLTPCVTGDELMLSHDVPESAGAASQRRRDPSSTAEGDPTNAPAPCVMELQEFESAAAAGTLLEVHSDLFTHALATHKHGITMEALEEVIKAGEGAMLVKLHLAPAVHHSLPHTSESTYVNLQPTIQMSCAWLSELKHVPAQWAACAHVLVRFGSTSYLPTAATVLA